MALRTFWKGYLKLSLVTCPVAMVPATSESEKVRFHTLNRKTGDRVISRYVDSVTRKPADEARGYQRGEDDYVILDARGFAKPLEAGPGMGTAPMPISFMVETQLEAS